MSLRPKGLLKDGFLDDPRHLARRDDASARARRVRTPILIASLFLILIGSRAALIAYAGNATPFLDEWDADAAHLLKPYLQGHLTIGDLFYPINEHRIVFTKLAVLSIF